MSRRRDKASSSMAAAAMSLVQLERWLQDRTERRPVATSMPVLDGYIAAIVTGPVSISPLDWICPLLAIDADAFNHGGTAEFAAISAVAQHHNAISKTLSTNPDRFEPIHQRKPNGDVDARPWCLGFHAAMRPRISAWAPLLDTRNVNHGLLLPILMHCEDDQGRPLLGPTSKARTLRGSSGVALDGPFAETKEQLLGFYLVDCASEEAAIEAARDLHRANPGAVYEIRPIRRYLPGLEMVEMEASAE